MARPLRLAVADGTYHVTARGNERRAIVIDDLDRHVFLRLLGRTIDRFNWRCLSYCLMDNHFHLLIRTPEPNLPRGMQQLKGSFAQSFNRRHARVGHLFAGRYGAQLIQRDAHLLTVFRYIALNPVTAGVCDRPEGWRWSAHAALLGKADAQPFLAVGEALTLFGGAAAHDAYGRFVATDDVSCELPASAAAGDSAFLRAVLPERRPDPEIPLREWGAGRPPLDEILASGDRGAAIARAYRDHGYPMTAIARHLGCHVSTVSRSLRVRERAMLDCKI